jgi:hypothetical protein
MMNSRLPAGQIDQVHARSVVIAEILNTTTRWQFIITDTLDGEDGVRSRAGHRGVEYMLPAVHSPGMMRGRLTGAARSAADVQYTMNIFQCAQLQSSQFWTVSALAFHPTVVLLSTYGPFNGCSRIRHRLAVCPLLPKPVASRSNTFSL